MHFLAQICVKNSYAQLCANKSYKCSYCVVLLRALRGNWRDNSAYLRDEESRKRDFTRIHTKSFCILLFMNMHTLTWFARVATCQGSHGSQGNVRGKRKLSGKSGKCQGKWLNVREKFSIGCFCQFNYLLDAVRIVSPPACLSVKRMLLGSSLRCMIGL